MSIAHEAVCDGCGKRAPARYPPHHGIGNTNSVAWETMEYPEGWFLVVVSDEGIIPQGNYPFIQGYCSRRCVALGEVEE